VSAFLVSAKHIAALVDASIAIRAKYHGLTDSMENTKRDRALKMLAVENACSVNDRYFTSKARGGIPENPVEEFPAFELHVLTRVGIVSLLKAIDCYEYQSCEHAGWEGSDAERFCRELRCSLISFLPGYDDAPWGIE